MNVRFPKVIAVIFVWTQMALSTVSVVRKDMMLKTMASLVLVCLQWSGSCLIDNH